VGCKLDAVIITPQAPEREGTLQAQEPNNNSQPEHDAAMQAQHKQQLD